MADRKTNWVFSLDDARMDASTPRTSVRKPNVFRMIGFEASLDGPPSPFFGFREVHRFSNPELWSAFSTHDETSVITDLFLINFVIGESEYGYAWLFRAQRKNGSSTCDIIMSWWNSATAEFLPAIELKRGVPLPRHLDGVGGREMSVSVIGRLVYVLVEGEDPLLFYFDGTSPYTLNIVENTGPGSKPRLQSPRDFPGLGTTATTGDPDRPGAGGVWLTEFMPDEVGLFPTGDYGGGTPTSGGTGVSSTTGGSGVDQASLVRLKPGDYAFAYFLFNSTTGRRSALSAIAEARKEDFDPDGPTTTATGGTVTGALEPVPLYAAIEICYDKTLYDQAYIYRSVRVQDAGGTYIAAIYHLDKIIDLAEYHTTNNPLANPDLAQSIYWYELEDKQLAAQDVFQDPTLFDQDMPKGGASLWYENTLLVGSISGGAASSDEENRREDAFRGVGELKWSSLTEVSPELFSPQNRYYPPIPSNDILVLKQVGPNVFGFSRDRQYVVRKESIYIKVLSVHEGFGVSNARAAETVGSLAYFVGSKGMKSVDANAQLDDVRSVNQIIIEEWADSLDSVSLAFDSTMSVLFAHNPVEHETILFWFNTSRVTMLHDTNFQLVGRGAWPSDFQFDLALLQSGTYGGGNATYYNPLVERAFFLMNPPKNASDDLITDFRHRVFMVDEKRERTNTVTGAVGAQESHSLLLPLDYDSIHTVGAAFSAGSVLTLDGTTTVDDAIWGYTVYVLSSSTPSLIGKKATVRTRASATTLSLTSLTASQLYGLAVGDKIGLTPIYMKVELSPVGVQTEEGDQFAADGDPFRTRYVSSVGCAFSDVSGVTTATNPELCRFRAHLWRGNREDPTLTADTINPRTEELQQSIIEDEGVYYAGFKGTDAAVEGKYGMSGALLTPGVSIVCPGVYFRLLGIIVEGGVKESKRTGRVES